MLGSLPCWRRCAVPVYQSRMPTLNNAHSIIDWPDIKGVVDWAIPAWFEQRAAAHPLNAAVVSDSSRLSFAELIVQANRLAHSLQARGGAFGDRVGILMRHDELLIAA